MPRGCHTLRNTTHSRIYDLWPGDLGFMPHERPANSSPTATPAGGSCRQYLMAGLQLHDRACTDVRVKERRAANARHRAGPGARTPGSRSARRGGMCAASGTIIFTNGSKRSVLAGLTGIHHLPKRDDRRGSRPAHDEPEPTPLSKRPETNHGQITPGQSDHRPNRRGARMAAKSRCSVRLREQKSW